MANHLSSTATARVGVTAPMFQLQCVDSPLGVPRLVTPASYAGQWVMLLFYPRDFSFVCPTELIAFSARMEEFRQRNCQILGVSVDDLESHQRWLATPPSEGGLGPLQFPLAADPDGAAARAYEVWVPEKEVSTRGLFLIDPEGVLQYLVVHNLSVGRNTDEILRVLDALNTGGLCPASWTSADGTLDPQTALRPGRVLGHYRIERQLGVGNFGTVLAAWDLRLQRRVALKVLRKNAAEARDALLAEARAAAALNHPNICTIYAVEQEDGLTVIAMECLSGQLLSDSIAAGLSADQVRSLARQIAAGLAAAHARDIVHGDLKPANIFVTDEGAVKILDFGLARSQSAAPPTIVPPPAPQLAVAGPVDATLDLPAELRPTPTQTFEYPSSGTGGLTGTPAYMSPEQTELQASTVRSDVFAFGLIVYEMLTGRRALPQTKLAHLFAALQAEDLASSLLPHVPSEYHALLTRALARDANHRPPSSELAEQLLA